MHIHKLLLICIGTLLIGFQASCQQKAKPYAQLEIQGTMQNLDSLLHSYRSRPIYWAIYINEGCLFDLRINDVTVHQLKHAGSIAGTASSLNPYIMRSGKQKVSVKLTPFPGKTKIWDSHQPTFEPFKLYISYIDFSLPEEEQEEVIVLTMPELKLITDEGGIPSYTYEAEFEAKVPYAVNGYTDGIDLREIPDIEARVVAEFKKVRQWMVDREFDTLKKYLAIRDNEIGVTQYQSNKKSELEWEDYESDISNSSAEEFQPIEDYKLVFQAEGRLVTLHSKKRKGYPTALLRFKTRADTNNVNVLSLDLLLKMKKGTNKLIPTM